MSQSRFGMLLCLVSPAGGGKTTLRRKLLTEFADARPSISVTTRAPRAGEVDGVNYHFVARDTFEEKVSHGDLFEWEEVHGNYYGTLRTSIEAGIQTGMDLVFDIDIRGAQSLRRSYPKETVVVFIVPPSPEELLRRLTARGTTDSAELERRLATARVEYEALTGTSTKGRAAIDYLLVNDDLEQAYQQLCGIVRSERLKLSRMVPDLVARYAEVPRLG